jgi:hypothetical protein
LDLRSVRRFGVANQSLESRDVVDGNIGKNFTIERDAGALQSADKFAVGNLGHAASGINAHDPKRTEITLLKPAADVSVTKRLFDGFLGGTIQL